MRLSGASPVRTKSNSSKKSRTKSDAGVRLFCLSPPPQLQLKPEEGATLTKLQVRVAHGKSASADASVLDDSSRSSQSTPQPPRSPRQQHSPLPVHSQGSLVASSPGGPRSGSGPHPQQQHPVAQSSRVEYARSLLERTVTFLLGALEKRHLEFLPCLGNLLVEAVSELLHAARLPPAAVCTDTPTAAIGLSGSGATSDAAVSPSKNETSHQRRKANSKSHKKSAHAILSQSPLPLSPTAAARDSHLLADRKHSALAVTAESEASCSSESSRTGGASNRSSSTQRAAPSAYNRHSISPSEVLPPEQLDSKSVNSVTQSLHALLSAMDRLVLNEYIMSKSAATAATSSTQNASQPSLSSEEFEQRARRLVESAKSFGSGNAAMDSTARITPSPRASPDKATDSPTVDSAASAQEMRVRRAHSSVTPPSPGPAAPQTPNQLPATLQLPIASNMSSLVEVSSGSSSSLNRASPSQSTPTPLAVASRGSTSSLNSGSAAALSNANSCAPLGCSTCSAAAANRSAFGVPLKSTISPTEMKSEIEELARKIKSLAQGFRRMSENGERESSPEQITDASDARSANNVSIDKITIDSVDHGTILSPGITATPGAAPQPPDSAGKEGAAFSFASPAESAAAATTNAQASPTQMPSGINFAIERSVQSIQEPIKEMEKTVHEEIVEINGQKFKKKKVITRVTTKMKEQQVIRCPLQGGMTTYQMLHALVMQSTAETIQNAPRTQLKMNQGINETEQPSSPIAASPSLVADEPLVKNHFLQYVQISGKCNFSNPTLANFSMDWAPGVRTGGGNGGGDEVTPFVHMLTTQEFEFEPVHTLLRPPPRNDETASIAPETNHTSLVLEEHELPAVESSGDYLYLNQLDVSSMLCWRKPLVSTTNNGNGVVATGASSAIPLVRAGYLNSFIVLAINPRAQLDYYLESLTAPANGEAGGSERPSEEQLASLEQECDVLSDSFLSTYRAVMSSSVLLDRLAHRFTALKRALIDALSRRSQLLANGLKFKEQRSDPRIDELAVQCQALQSAMWASYDLILKVVSELGSDVIFELDGTVRRVYDLTLQLIDSPLPSGSSTPSTGSSTSATCSPTAVSPSSPVDRWSTRSASAAWQSQDVEFCLARALALREAINGTIEAQMRRCNLQRFGLNAPIANSGAAMFTGLQLLGFGSRELAEQIALMDSELFSMIEIKELIAKSHDGTTLSAGSPLGRFCEFFNSLGFWAATQVLQPGLDMAQREKLVLKFFKVMRHLYYLQEINALLALASQLTLPLIERLDWSESTRRQFFSTEPGAVSMLALVDPTSRKYLQLERAVFERAIGLAACSCCSGLGVGPGASPAPSRSATSNTSVATGSSGAAATDASTSVARVSPPRLEPQHGTLGRPSVPAKGPSPDHEVGPNETPLHVALFGTPPASSSAATSAQRVLPVVPYLGRLVERLISAEAKESMLRTCAAPSAGASSASLTATSMASASGGSAGGSPSGTEIVNYTKCWSFYRLLERIILLKRRNLSYEFKRNDAILKFFGNFSRFLSCEQLYQLSYKIKEQKSY